MKKSYSSPSIRFERLLIRENIANPCWAHAASDKKAKTLYYDTPGIGYIKFSVSGKSCGDAEFEIDEKVPSNNPVGLNEIMSGGKSGQPFGGDYSTYKPS